MQSESERKGNKRYGNKGKEGTIDCSLLRRYKEIGIKGIRSLRRFEKIGNRKGSIVRCYDDYKKIGIKGLRSLRRFGK